MATLLLALLALGLAPISLALSDNAKGPDARLGLAYLTVFLIWPWWAGAATLTAIAWFRGAFVTWHSSLAVRLAVVGIGFALLVMCYLVRATHLGLPSMLDRMTCILMPAALLVLLGWLLHPSLAAVVPSSVVCSVALLAIGAPALLTSSKVGYALVKESPEMMAEWRAHRERTREELRRKEEESNTELRDLRERLATLPPDCHIDELLDLHTGNRPEVFRAEVTAAILRRPTIEADLAQLLRTSGGGYSIAPYMIANLLPKPSAALAPALNQFMESQAATFSHYKNAYPQVFAREANGFHNILQAAKRVMDAGGDLSAGLDAWRRELNELPNWPERNSLLAAVNHLQKVRR